MIYQREKNDKQGCLLSEFKKIMLEMLEMLECHSKIKIVHMNVWIGLTKSGFEVLQNSPNNSNLLTRRSFLERDRYEE